MPRWSEAPLDVQTTPRWQSAPLAGEVATVASSPTAAPTWAQTWRDLQTSIGNIGSAANEGARLIARGVTLGGMDELAAGANAVTGLAGYDETLAAQRERDQQFDAAHPYVSAGTQALGAAGGMAAMGIPSLAIRGATGLMGRMGLGALEGGAIAGVQGFNEGEGGFQDRAQSAAQAAPYGAAAGGIIGGVAGRMANANAMRSVPSVDDLRGAAQTAYRTADNAGVVVSQPSFTRAVGDIANEARNAGIDRTLHPRATAAVERLQEAAAAPRSLQELDILRRVARSAARSNDADERRIGELIIDRLDDYVTGLQPGDVVAGNPAVATQALTEARGLWSRMRKGELLEDLMERAETRASQFSGSGLENAIRTEFRQLVMNPRRMRGFTHEEQDAITAVARGGPIGNVMRAIGRFAPRGPVGVATGGGAGYMALGGGPEAFLGGATVLGAGEIGRRAATAATRHRADMASALARSGGRMPDPQASPGQQAILELLLRGSAQQSPEAGDAFRRRLGEALLGAPR